MNNSLEENLCRTYGECAFLVLLNVPKGTSFGIDLKEWRTDKGFRGLKMIPPGTHFIHWSPTCRLSGNLAPRSGFFYFFKKFEILFKMWNENAEEISESPVPDDQVAIIKGNFFQMDQFLAPYPRDIESTWLTLSEYITDDLINKLSPDTGYIRPGMPLTSCDEFSPVADSLVAGSSSMSQQVTRKRRKWLHGKMVHSTTFFHDVEPVIGNGFHFSKIPPRFYPEGSTASEITFYALDSIYVLEQMLSKHRGYQDLIGELQYAFIAFIVGFSLDAFEHWKDLISLICSSETGISKYTEFYEAFLEALEAQLKEIPDDFLTDMVTEDNFIYWKLKCLFRSIQNTNTFSLQKNMHIFMRSMSEKFHWNFSNLDDDDDDDEPIIVDIKTDDI